METLRASPEAMAASSSRPPIFSDLVKDAVSQQRNCWIPVICGAAILTIGIGARQSFGIFQKPIAADLNVGREVWSFANALALLLMGPAHRSPAISPTVSAPRAPSAPAARSTW